jgi:hypothetical protein
MSVLPLLVFLIFWGVVIAVLADRRRARGGPAPVAAATADGATGFAVGGRTFACMVCAETTFDQREAQLNTAVATFFNFDWANASATCLVCQTCAYVHWFLPRG